MTSQKQIEANRRNARKSTGPRTPEGKRASRLNAFKHGMTAESVVIPSGQSAESAEEFQALLTALRHDLRPHGTLQELLVEHIAINQWRLRRVYRAELTGVTETGKSDDQLRSAVRILLHRFEPEKPLPVFLPAEHIADKLLRYQRVLESSTSRLLAELRRLQAADTSSGQALDSPPIGSQRPEEGA